MNFQLVVALYSLGAKHFLTTVVGIGSIVSDKYVHTVGHRLTEILAVNSVPNIIAFGIHHGFELQVAVLLGFVTIVVTEIVVVTLVLKSSEKVSHTVDTGPIGRWTASIGGRTRVASAVWINSDGSKIGYIVLVPIFVGVSVEGVEACLCDFAVDIGIARAVPARARTRPRGGLFGVTKSDTSISICRTSTCH